MSNGIPTTLLLVAALTASATTNASAASARPSESQRDDFVSRTLPNGLRVSLFADSQMPIVATQVWYHIGSANESGDNRGFAHLFEHLMFGVTKNHAKDDYANHHERYGGYSNAHTTQDETVYVSQISPEHHEPVLAMEADRMVNLLLNEENLANEKKIVTEELRLRIENDPESRLFAAAIKAVLGTHPYAFLPTGTKEDIARATLGQCKAFYRKYYRPRNAHLVIAGPIDLAPTMALVEKYFGPIPKGGETPKDIPSLLTHDFPRDVDLTEDLPPVETALLAYPLPPASSPDHAALLVMQQILSRSNVDPFEEELVKRRGKAVFAETEFVFQRRGGAVIFAAAYLPYRRKVTGLRLMEETRDKVSERAWLTDAALASAKRRMLRRDLDRLYFAESMANSIGSSRWWYGDEKRAFDLEQRIRGVTRDDVAAAYEKYIVRRAPIRVYIKPLHVPLKVRLFGWLYTLLK